LIRACRMPCPDAERLLWRRAPMTHPEWSAAECRMY